MDFRQLVRGTVDWSDLEAIGGELARRAGKDAVRIEYLDANNWLSTPLAVDGEWFVKVITPQNARVHAVLTSARNLGAFTSGTEGFFERFDGAADMARHEFEATKRMHEAGLRTPEPVEHFAFDDFGVVVLEFLPDFHTLDDHPNEGFDEVAAEVFESLAAMHAEGLAHGDLSCENVIVVDGEPYFIDATLVREGVIEDARAYDVACALSVLSPRTGADRAVEFAVDAYDVDVVVDATRFVDFVNLRPDHEFDVARLKGAIDKAATR